MTVRPIRFQLASTTTLAGWQIDWGDGQSDSLAGDATSASHTYVDGPKGYSITATATDASSQTGTVTLPLLVQPAPPWMPVLASDLANTSQDNRQTQENLQSSGPPYLTISGSRSIAVGTAYTLTLAASGTGADSLTAWQIDWVTERYKTPMWLATTWRISSTVKCSTRTANRATTRSRARRRTGRRIPIQPSVFGGPWTRRLPRVAWWRWACRRGHRETR